MAVDTLEKAIVANPWLARIKSRLTEEEFAELSKDALEWWQLHNSHLPGRYNIHISGNLVGWAEGDERFFEDQLKKSINEYLHGLRAYFLNPHVCFWKEGMVAGPAAGEVRRKE
jgi:hypothetical protein